MAARHWIGVVHLHQAVALRDGGFVAFSRGAEAPVRKVEPGDHVVFYAPKTDFDGDTVQAFVALAQVADGPVTERDMPGTAFRPWSRPALFQEVNQFPVRPLLEALSFVQSPRHWGMAFRRSLFEIPAADFDLIATGMRPGS